jgi:NodT family efflux transporter outer membrane factor (OMF) lipoprotein
MSETQDSLKDMTMAFKPRTMQARKMTGLLPLAAAVALMAGCASQPAGMNAPKAGGAAVPSAWQYGAVSPTPGISTVALDEAWWKHFNTPELDALIGRVLASNANLGMAALKVRQAQLRANIADAAQLPSVAAKVSVGASRSLDRDTGTTRSASASLGASWELDLWGRLSAQRDAAQWEATATEEDRRGVALSLVGTTARLYWQLAYLDERVVSADKSLAYARQTLSLVKAHHQAGTVSGVEEAQAEQAVRAQEGALSQLTQARMEARQAIALLLDGPTQTAQVPEHPSWPTGAWPTIAPDLPADVLARRPDVRSAESRLRGAFAAVDVTRTSYYPAITLTGSAGGASTTLGSVLDNPVGTLGAALVLPFLQWRDMQRNVAISQADADAAVLGFRQTLYTALADVDKALSARTQLNAQALAQNERLAQAQKVERLTELRYRSGAEPLKSWLDAQEARRQAELAASDVRFNQLSNWVSLVQALGGGASAAAGDNTAVAKP